MIGETLDGRYRVLRKLGDGGMGEVYLVEHVSLGRREALKVLRPELATVAHFVSRFRREARATNRVQHPHIVSVYDFGQLPDGRFYLTMEYAEGVRLDEELRRHGVLPVGRAMHLLAQLADAIDHAHARGVVHRDIKPENLVIVEHRGKSDFLKVLDFGIAKIVAPDYRESQALSSKNESFGTPKYMSPEQFSGVGDEPRSDIYAIGCIAFELLVGEPPFLGRMMELMHAHLTQPPDRPSKRRPGAGITAAVDDIVACCLAKDPARRFQTGGALRVAVEEVLGTSKARSGIRRRQTAPSVEFGDEATDVPSQPSADTMSDTDDSGLDQTQRLSIDDVERALADAVVELAEAILDVGHHDQPLAVALANMQHLEADLAQLDDEQRALEGRARETEQAARERQGALRFSLGELYFERGQRLRAGGSAKDIEQQIPGLEERVTGIALELERELATITEHGIDLATTQAIVEERMAALRPSLAALCDAIVPTFPPNAIVTPLIYRLRSLRETLAALRKGERRPA